MGTRLYPISPSKLGTWQDCPRRFFFRYVEKRKAGGSWAHFSMGNAIHNALRDWWEVPASQRNAAKAAELVTTNWQPGGFRDKEQSDHWRESAKAMVWRYLTGCEPGAEPRSTERTLAARTSGQTISGRIDRLDVDPENPDALVVIDYKTGKRVPTTDEVRGSQALAIYAICVQQSLRTPCTKVELHHVPSGVRVAWEHTPESLARQLDRIEQISSEMETAEARYRESANPGLEDIFPAVTGALCGYCDFRQWCPVGAAAAPAQPPWAGLPVAEGGYDPD